MSALKGSLIAIVIACLSLINAAAAAGHRAIPVHDAESRQLKGIVDNLLRDNDAFVQSHNSAYFKPLVAGQWPRATVVTCSDSQVNTQAFDKSPFGDLFVIRNFGNQLATAEGSVEYGVQQLHTPLLIFVGHSSCGAIKVASGSHARESRATKRELKSIRIARGMTNMDGVRANVNNQVAAALGKFRREVKQGELTVIGAIYDFANDLGQGNGKLSVINLNGDTNSARIRASTLLSGVVVEEKSVVDPEPGAIEDGDSSPSLGNAKAPPYSYP